MNAMQLIHALNDRGIDLTLNQSAGRVDVRPASKLTDDDRAAIRHHLPTIKRLLSVDYSGFKDGWQHDPTMPERLILVKGGRLLDSCMFNTEGAGLAFLVLIACDYTPRQAFRAAAAIEDGERDPIKLEAIARAA